VTVAFPSGKRPGIVLGGREYRHMPKAILLEEASVPVYVRRTIILVVVAMLAFVFWAATARLDEVAVAPGEIVPSGSVRIIQHLDGGTIGDISVREGQLVKEGDILLRLDGRDAEADLEQARARYWGLVIRAERLKAYAEGRKPEFTSVPAHYRTMVNDQEQILASQRAARDNQAAVIGSQIAQAQSDLDRIDKQISTAKREQAVLRELSSIRDELEAEKLVTRTVTLDTKRTLIVSEGDLLRLTQERVSTTRSIEELRNRLRSLDTDRRQTALDEMGVASNELAQVAELITKLEGKIQRLEIRAPITGLVQDLKYKTVGGVIAPGGQVLRLVPTQDVVQAEAKISTSDVGHVGVGQTVRVKVSTYDFMRYGTVAGKVVSISATTFLEEGNSTQPPYFKGVVELERNYVGNFPGRYPVMPGMTVQADIVTNQKSVLEYLLRPIVVALDEGMRER
jgi:adhesin transport system membrane fusion protein